MVKVIEKSLGTDENILRYENLRLIKEEFVKDIFLKRWKNQIELLKKKFQSKFIDYPEYLKEENLRAFGIRFTHNTNAIEGSTLNYRETAMVIEHPDTPINKPVSDINEVQMHMQCYEEMLLISEELSMQLILKWHKKLFSLNPIMNELSGKIRNHNVKVKGSNHVFPEPYLVKPLLDELWEWYNQNKNKIHPVLLACLMHLRFVSIHPFTDGNGRMTRLLMNFILYKNEYPMFDISAKIRLSYFKVLERSNLNDDEMIFVGWFLRNYIKYVSDF